MGGVSFWSVWAGTTRNGHIQKAKGEKERREERGKKKRKRRDGIRPPRDGREALSLSPCCVKLPRDAVLAACGTRRLLSCRPWSDRDAESFSRLSIPPFPISLCVFQPLRDLDTFKNWRANIHALFFCVLLFWPSLNPPTRLKFPPCLYIWHIDIYYWPIVFAVLHCCFGSVFDWWTTHWFRTRREKSFSRWLRAWKKMAKLLLAAVQH